MPKIIVNAIALLAVAAIGCAREPERAPPPPPPPAPRAAAAPPPAPDAATPDAPEDDRGGDQRVVATAFAGTELPGTAMISADGNTAVACAVNGNGMASWAGVTCYTWRAGAGVSETPLLDMVSAQQLFMPDDKAAVARITASVTTAATKLVKALATNPRAMTHACYTSSYEPGAHDCAGTKIQFDDSGFVFAGRSERIPTPPSPRQGCALRAGTASVWLDDTTKRAIILLEFFNSRDECGVESRTVAVFRQL